MGKREENKKRITKKILSNALDLFVEHGFQTCTIDDIVKGSDIARGTFYLYFPDKLTVFETLTEKMYQPIVQILTSTLEDLKANKDSPFSHQIRYIRTAIELAIFVETQKKSLPLHFRELWAAGPQGEAIRNWRVKIESLAEALIDTSIEYSIIRPIPTKMTSFAVVGATERVIWGWYQGELKGSRRVLAQEMAALFWRGIEPSSD
jgi:AcrR family transcriptional regulator